MTDLYQNHPDGSRNDLDAIGANNTRLSGDNGGSGGNAPGSSTMCLVDRLIFGVYVNSQLICF